MDKSLVIYSGGLDSTVLLRYMMEFGDVEGIFFNYGQRHLKELDHARDICSYWNIKLHEINIGSISYIFGSNSQTCHSSHVPDGHYQDETMRTTVVPNRNMIMISIATSLAISNKCNYVAYGAHSGDHAIYPDCRQEFVECLGMAIRRCDYNPPKLIAPFLNKDKAEIVRIGRDFKVPMHKTWSCYKGLEKHCGKCGTCVERREAFSVAQVKDETVYL